MAGETIVVTEGEPFVFDDSFEHEAWNEDPEHSRIVLIFDVWHPDLTPEEIDAVRAMFREVQSMADARAAKK